MIMEQDQEYVEERKDQVQDIVDLFWGMIANYYEEEDLSEDQMLDIFAALGIIMGSAMNEAFFSNPTLPYQLFGISSDFAHQTLYTSRYGLDLQELENARQKTH